MNSVVDAVAHVVPERVVTNDELSKLMNTSDQWIRERTGISERRFVEQPTPTSVLASEAGAAAIAQSSVELDEIDYILASTLSPDFYFPGIGPIVQQRLGLNTIPALDIRVQCSGLVYGLSTAHGLIASSQARCVLLLCAEVQSPVLNLSDEGRDTAVLFGDGAGALVIKAEEGDPASATNDVRGYIDSLLGSDGSGAEALCVRAPGTATKGFFTQEALDEGTWRPHMDGRLVFKHAVSRMGDTAEELLSRNGISTADVSLLLPHQANLRINEAVRERVGFAPEQVFNTIEHYGNTTAATIPIGMSIAEKEGRLKRGDLVMTLAFGAGFTWGANLIRW